MAGAYSTFARGSEAVFWNPANLGFRNEGLPSGSITTYAINVNVGNNWIDLDLYNEFFTDRNKVLTSNDVDRLLGEIGDGGIRADAGADVSVLAIAWRNFGVSYESNTYASLELPKDLAEMVFKGVEQKTYDFTPHLRAESIGKLNLAYGRVVARGKSIPLPMIRKLTFSEIALGGSVAWIMGYGFFETQQSSLRVVVSDDGITANGVLVGRGARLKRELQPDGDYETKFDGDGAIVGNGYGLNLAASAKTQSGYTFSVVLRNVLSKIKWDRSTVEVRRTLDTGDPKFIFGDEQLDDLEEDDVLIDEDREIGSFTSSRPFEFRVGVGRDWSVFKYAMELGLENDRSLFAVGGGYRLKIMNLYAGYRWDEFNNFSLGLGIGGRYFMWDLAVGTRGGITPETSKGFMVASSMRLGF